MPVACLEGLFSQQSPQTWKDGPWVCPKKPQGDGSARLWNHPFKEALKKTIESLTAVIPTLDPPPLTALGLFFRGGGVCFFIDSVVE